MTMETRRACRAAEGEEMVGMNRCSSSSPTDASNRVMVEWNWVREGNGDGDIRISRGNGDDNGDACLLQPCPWAIAGGGDEDSSLR